MTKIGNLSIKFKLGEIVTIGKDIYVQVVEVSGRKAVTLRFVAPKDVKIMKLANAPRDGTEGPTKLE